MKRGSLICVGTGIKGVAHLTLEAAAWIEQADVVCHCCSDPASIMWIKAHARAEEDLYACYADDRRRIDTYHMMVDQMLSHVRAGKDVCGVFYGHPGLFVYPTHQAIEIARQEGYRAAMLAGVSALDCLFADVGFDPSHVGCQMYEATDLILRRRELHSESHAVIWQIGCVGDAGFRFKGYDNRNLGVLLDYLMQYYDGNHQVCHYQGTQYPMCPSSVEWVALRHLGRDTRVTGISTLYIPPSKRRQTDVATGEAMGMLRRVATADGGSGERKYELAIKVPLAEERSQYEPPPPRSRLATFINELGTNPRLLGDFFQNPQLTAAGHADLDPEETAALLSMHPGRIRMAIKKGSRSPHVV